MFDIFHISRYGNLGLPFRAQNPEKKWKDSTFLPGGQCNFYAHRHDGSKTIFFSKT